MWLIILITLLFLIPMVLTAKSFAPWLPTRKRDLDRILNLANLQPGETFYDLGCGNGRVAIHISKNTTARVIAVEYYLPLFLLAVLNNIRQHGSGITFKFANLYTEDLKKADVVYLFGTPKTVNKKLKPKLLSEMKPGSRIISYAFPISGLKPTGKSKPSKDELPIFLYKISNPDEDEKQKDN